MDGRMVEGGRKDGGEGRIEEEEGEGWGNQSG